MLSPVLPGSLVSHTDPPRVPLQPSGLGDADPGRHLGLLVSPQGVNRDRASWQPPNRWPFRKIDGFPW